MQQRWTDRPDDETDLFDRLMAFSDTVLRRHIGRLIKIGPPLFGFAIFVLYFYRNGFYPSFDLFQFSSLLIAAACIGFCFVGILIAALLVPGLSIFHQFMDNKAVKENPHYPCPYDEAKRGNWVLFVSLAYVLPYLLTGALLLTVTVLSPRDFLKAMLVLPIPVSLVFGIVLQQRFGLKAFSFLTYMWAAYIALVCVGGLMALILVQSYTLIDAQHRDAWEWPLLLGVPIVLAIVTGVCSVLHHLAGFNPSLHFSTFFAVIIGGYSGILTNLPETTVKKLGLGNYEATSIILSPEYCEGGVQTRIALKDGCALDDVHVVWSLGENITLRLPEKQLVQIPAHFVRTMIRKAE